MDRSQERFCPEGMTGGPVSNLGDTFVSNLGNTPGGKNPLDVSEKGNRFRRGKTWLGRLAKAEQNSEAYALEREERSE